MIKDTKKKTNIFIKILNPFKKMALFYPKLLKIDKHVTETKQRKTMYYLYALLGTILAIGWTLSGFSSANDGSEAFTLAIGITLAVSTLLLVLVLGIVFTTRK